jgi:DNA-binding GntR family transcriptional regulator
MRELCEGRYQCGQELNEVVLSAHYHVSRTPVRDALRRLAAERLVVNSRNRKTTVIRPTRREIEETYQVRSILESAAARLAASQMSNRRLSELRELAAKAIPAAGHTWGAPELRFDLELHRSISDACGNSLLRDEIERYGRIVRFVRSQVARNPEVLQVGHEQHQCILAALEKRNGAAAADAMEAHILAALESVLEGFSGFPPVQQPMNEA